MQHPPVYRFRKGNRNVAFSAMLDLLHKHLKQLQREQLISTWTDKEIQAGGNLNKEIARELHETELFLPLVSPDYIASGYCYDLEFKKALELESKGVNYPNYH